jgi:hypothetical protein
MNTRTTREMLTTTQEVLIGRNLEDELTYTTAEVSSNGRTTWVYLDGMCVARFCPLSHEILEGGQLVSTTHVWDGERGLASDDLKRFGTKVRERFGISIEDEHTPLYILDTP